MALYARRAGRHRGRGAAMAFLAALTSSVGVLSAPSNELMQLVDELEQGVSRVAKAAESMLETPNLCAESSRKCSACNFDICGNSKLSSYAPDGDSCTEEFGSPSECSSSGQRISTERSAIRVTDSVDILSDNIDSLHSAYKDVCATTSLDSSFKANYESVSGAAWQYLGTPQGVYRIFPAHIASPGSDGRCYKYDPRTRPWYVSATTGAKRVILIIDRSGSMDRDYPTRMDVAQEAATSVIDTLTNADYFGIVSFSSSAQVYSSKLQRATAKNRRGGRDYVRSLYPGGSTYFDSAFGKAFDLIDNANSEETGSNACRTVILFLTDGKPTVGSGDAALNLIQTRNTGNAFIVSYVLGQDDSTETILEYPRKISCGNRGLYSHITSTSDLIGAMNKYYQFLAVGLNRRSVVWSEPYEDALGIGQVTTASLPIYDNTTQPPTLVGVAGVDVRMEVFNSFGDSSTDLLGYLIQRSSVCSSFSLSDCEFERLRDDFPCNATFAETCTDADSGVNCAADSSVSPWCEDTGRYASSSAYTSLACCDDDASTTAALAGTISGVAAAVVVVALAAFAFKRYKKHKAARAASSKAASHDHNPQPTPAAQPRPVPSQFSGGNPIYASPSGGAAPPPSASYPVQGGGLTAGAYHPQPVYNNGYDGTSGAGAPPPMDGQQTAPPPTYTV